MDLEIGADGLARLGSRAFPCALGRAGRTTTKVEGDGATPIGRFLCRWVYYRPDRLAVPQSGLRAVALSSNAGWCDDPADPRYNCPVERPYPARSENLWRADGVYDLIVPLGYNDAPVVPGRGSAIFLHLARPGYLPTEGCVALGLADLLAFLAQADPTSGVVINPS